MNLSVCIIAIRQEWEHLKRCISTLPAGCEVIVLWNAHKQGATWDVAKEKTYVDASNREITFYSLEHDEPLASFADLRNEALQHCTREWVLSIDCDERIPTDSLPFFTEILPTYGAGIGGVLCGVYGVQAPLRDVHDKALRTNNTTLRLFRNHYGFRWYGHCHEQIGWCIQDAGYSIMDSVLLIYHVGYDAGKEVLTNKMRRNIKLLSRQVAEETDAELFVQFLSLLLRDGNNLAILLGLSDLANAHE